MTGGYLRGARPRRRVQGVMSAAELIGNAVASADRPVTVIVGPDAWRVLTREVPEGRPPARPRPGWSWSGGALFVFGAPIVVASAAVLPDHRWYVATAAGPMWRLPAELRA